MADKTSTAPKPFARSRFKKEEEDLYADAAKAALSGGGGFGEGSGATNEGLLASIGAKPVSGPSSFGSIVVSNRQRGNPILKSIRAVPWEYGEIEPDYLLGQRTCALYLSLRYHDLNPQYVHQRLKKLGKQYELRILLVEVDTKDPYHSLKQLTTISFLADLTIMLSWSNEESGRILETYKAFENKPADLIMEKQEAGTTARVVDALTSIRSVNRTDAMTLLSNFSSLSGVLRASKEELALCPGFGPLKAAKLHSALRQPFMKQPGGDKKAEKRKSTN